MDFFFDRSIPEKLARMLDHYDRQHSIIYHDDRFHKQTSDVEWLSAIEQWNPKPVVVSGDGRILRNPAELQVLRGLPLTFFLFTSGWCNLRWDEYAWKVIRVWPKIVSASAASRPTVFKIPIGAVKVERIGLTDTVGRGSGRG